MVWLPVAVIAGAVVALAATAAACAFARRHLAALHAALRRLDAVGVAGDDLARRTADTARALGSRRDRIRALAGATGRREPQR